MATVVSPQLRFIATQVVHHCGLSSAVLSGMVPDKDHLDNGGYHCSVEDLRRHGNAGDYSHSRPDDKGFNERFCAAFDVSMNRSDMIRCYKRVHAVWKNPADPRRKYINCVNVWDGSGDAVRLDFVTGKAKFANKSHTWHIHGDLPRRWVLDDKAARAWVSMFRGDSMAEWVAAEEMPRQPATKPIEKAPAKATPVKDGPTKAPPAKTPPAKVPVGKPAPARPVVHAPGSRELRYTPGKKPLSGADVAYVQRYIGTAWMGAADGIAGARFRAGVKKYQAMRGVKADGVIGPATWRSLGVRASY